MPVVVAPGVQQQVHSTALCHLTTPAHVPRLNTVSHAPLLQVFRFMHLAPEKADYKCSFKSANTGSTASSCGFDAPASVTAPPSTSPGGVEVVLEVGFEPSSVGESLRDTLVVASPVGGEYQVPLVGRCLPPKPQGPIDVAKVGRGCWGVGCAGRLPGLGGNPRVRCTAVNTGGQCLRNHLVHCRAHSMRATSLWHLHGRHRTCTQDTFLQHTRGIRRVWPSGCTCLLESC